MSRPIALTIGELSRRTGCSVETIRYYERIELLPPPPRTAAGYRLYGGAHEERLRFVRRARELGFSLGEVRALLRLAEGGDRACAEARALASVHLADIRAKIGRLEAMEAVLEGVVRRCDDGPHADCALIATLAGDTRVSGAR